MQKYFWLFAVQVSKANFFATGGHCTESKGRLVVQTMLELAASLCSMNIWLFVCCPNRTVAFSVWYSQTGNSKLLRGLFEGLLRGLREK